MNEQPLDSDFSTSDALNITPAMRNNFSEIARWAKFLAIIGFVGIGLTVIFALIIGLFMNSLSNELVAAAGMISTTALMIAYLLIAALYFFPILYLFRFAGKMQLALKTNDNEELQASFANLKSMFKFIGILTIIVLGFYVLAIIGSTVFGAFATL